MNMIYMTLQIRLQIVLELLAECSAVTTVPIGLPVGLIFYQLLVGSRAGNVRNHHMVPSASGVLVVGSFHMSTCLVRLLDDVTITSQSTPTMNLSFERRAHRRSGSTAVLPLKKLAEKPFFSEERHVAGGWLTFMDWP